MEKEEKFIRNLTETAKLADLVQGSYTALDSNTGSKKLPLELIASKAEAYGMYRYSGTFNTDDALNIPITQTVGRTYKVKVSTTASITTYVYHNGKIGSGRSFSENFTYDESDLSASRDCIRIYFNSANNSFATIDVYVRDYEVAELSSELSGKDGAIPISGTFSSGQYIEIPIPTKVGEKYVLEYTTTATTVTRYVYKMGKPGSGRSINRNELVTYTSDDLAAGRDCIRLYFNVANNDTIDGTLYKISKHSLSTHERNEVRSAAFLGASYVTFSGWIPSGRASYYPVDTIPDVDDVSKCWWHIVLRELGWSLFKNDSWSGTTICNTVQSGMPTSSSFVNRAETSFGSEKVLEPKPSAIFVEGGINDTSLGTEVGSCQYSGWTDSDLLQVGPAFCKMLDTLTRYNPGARIIVVSCNVSSAIHSMMAEACLHYKAELIKVTDISGSTYTVNGHPNAAGHLKMAEQVVSAIKSK